MISFGTFTVSTLFFILVTAFITHTLTKSREKANRNISTFNKAASNFTQIFENILSQLREPIDEESYFTGTKSVYETLKLTFDAQNNAFHQFKRFLKGNDLTSLTEAWENYYPPIDNHKLRDEESDFNFFSEYISETVEVEKEKRLQVINHVERLISFAKPK